MVILSKWNYGENFLLGYLLKIMEFGFNLLLIDLEVMLYDPKILWLKSSVMNALNSQLVTDDSFTFSSGNWQWISLVGDFYIGSDADTDSIFPVIGISIG